jgi:2-oxoisovalerate dehydrogenase E1 component alpha subunit
MWSKHLFKEFQYSQSSCGFRVGHHSTSDDSSAYRSVEEVKQWENFDSPISRLRQYLEHKGWWDDTKECSWKEEAKKMVRCN